MRTVGHLQHVYRPRGTSRDLFTNRSDEILLSGPAGTGKSRACLEKLHAVALKYPTMKGLILRKVQATLPSTALKTWNKFVIPEAKQAGIVAYYGGSTEEPAQYRYENGSSIEIGGLDKDTKIMSSEYDVIYVQEAIELAEAEWEAATTRLRNGVMPYQQIFADTNPSFPTHWLKTRCDSGKTVILESRHEDNPVYFDDNGRVTVAGKAYIEKLDSLTGVRYLRLKKGLWVAAEGSIYEDFDPAKHVVDNFEIPKSWPRFWVVDFGYRHPFVLQWWAENPDGVLYLYREIYTTGRIVEEHAIEALRQVTDARGNWTEPRPTALLCDHDAEDRATLEKHLGFSSRAANKAVSTGIQAVQKRLKENRIKFLRKAVVQRDQNQIDAKRPASTIEEIPGYVWDTGGGKKIKEAPLKENDDGCDAMRYVVAHKDLAGSYNVRWL